MNNRRTPKRNFLLNALSPEIYARLEEHLQIISLPRDCDIYQHSGKIDYVYFPISSIVSVVKIMEDGSSPEVAVIGRDGLVGIDLFLGSTSVNSKVFVQSAGYGFRIKAALIKKEFDNSQELRNLILGYMQSLFIQSSQIAACYRFHSIEHQVCRFLLGCLDRWDSNRISLTHERIANLLGVRRGSVTEVSGHLAKAGYIEYRRGCVTVLDRAGLESIVCECYEVLKKEMIPKKVPVGASATGARPS